MDTITSNPAPYRNKRGCLIWLSVIGLGFALLVVGYYQFENHRGRKALAEAREAFSKEGESLDLQVVLPPAVPADQNFCATPALDGIGDPRIYEQKWPSLLSREFFKGAPQSLHAPLSEWGEFFRRGKPVQVNGKVLTDVEVIRDALLPVKPFLDELITASSRPLAQFTPISREREVASDALVKTLGLARVCRILALAALETNAPDDAVSYIRIMHKFRQAHRREGNDLGLLGAYLYLGRLENGIYHGMKNHQWRAEHLTCFADRSANFDPAAEWLQAVRHATVSVFDSGPDLGRDGPFGEGEFRLMPAGWILQNQANWIKESLSRNILPLKSGSLEAWYSAANAPLPRSNSKNLISRSGIPYLAGLARDALYRKACGQLSELAIALEGYFLKHRRYPETLEVVAPEYIGVIPKDFDGSPMRYSVTGDGQRFKIWSVRIDKVDDWKGIRPDTEKARIQPIYEDADYVLDIWAPDPPPPVISKLGTPKSKRGPQKSK